MDNLKRIFKVKIIRTMHRRTYFLKKILSRIRSRRFKEGDIIYVPTELYVGHARDDFHGGRATVNKVGKDFGSWWYIEVKENPGSCYSVDYILKNQKKWRKEYGDAVAHPVPDFSPEFNED
jgi:hypothetical protein